MREILVGDKHKNKDFIENRKCYGYLKADVESGYTLAEGDVILILIAKFTSTNGKVFLVIRNISSPKT